MSELTTDELVALLASAPDQLEVALAAIAPTPPASEASADDALAGEERWTPSEIVGHLCDAARYWGARMRLALYEDTPQLEEFDQDAFVRLAAYRYTPIEALAREYRLVSATTVALLRGLRPDQWERVGVHPEVGPLTIRRMVEIAAGHELNHARQLAASAER